MTQSPPNSSEDGITVLEHLAQRLDTQQAEMDRRFAVEHADMDRRFDTIKAVYDGYLRNMQTELDRRFAESRVAAETALTAQKSAVDAALVAAEKAVLKAEELASQRAEQQNEWRQTVDDITALKMPRAETETLVKVTSDRHGQAIEALTVQVADLTARMNQAVGSKGNSAQMSAWMFAALGALVGIAGIVIALTR